MRKRLVLFLGFLLLFYACKDSSTPQNTIDDVSLEKLIVEDISVLEKMDEKLVYNFGEVKKYSISLTVRPKNRNAVDLVVMTNDSETIGSFPYYTCNLSDGTNEIKIILTSKKDALNKKIYTIKITKENSNTPDEESSKLKELKVDGNSIISLLDDKNIATLAGVPSAKDRVALYVLPHNSNARITVSNEDEVVQKIDNNNYSVNLAFGANEIRVVVNSEAEGEKLHIIKIYREEDLKLKSFNVDGNEYCDENTGDIKESVIRFLKEKTEVIVKVEARADYATITLKHNENEIKPKDGSYKITLERERDAIEVIVKGRGGVKSESYKVTFMRPSNTNTGELLILNADDKDILHLILKDNIITLDPCNNDKTSLKLEARASGGVTVKVLQDNNEVSGDGIYNITLKEGINKIVVQLYTGSNLVNTYSIFIKRYPAEEILNGPSGDEVQIDIVLSDGVNGSPVDGSYINILKTKTKEVFKRVLVRNGKAKVNLTKKEFYDFKVEGRKSEAEKTLYAASDVISYYIDENIKVVPIVQFPLQRVISPCEAPSILEFKFGGVALNTTDENSTEQMKDVSIKVVSSSPVEELQWNSPLPMLSVGYVPTNDLNQDFLYATKSGNTIKNSEGKYESSWVWYSPYSMKLIKEDAFDVVIVLYDRANNRLEYHVRFKTSNATTEDASITVSDFNMEFKSYPTKSRLFTVAEDAFTNNSSHYSNTLYFKVKKGSSHVTCIGFDLYRKCIESGEKFRRVKHFIYDSPRASSASYLATAYHTISDNDGVLEDEKTYQYKIVAFTSDGKKSKLDSSPMLEIKVPKSTSLLLDYPLNQAISLSDAQNMDYVFKLSNPKILETAKEIRLGFLISDRQGVIPYCSKFKYVFEDSNGKDEIYFAKLSDAQGYQGYYSGTKYSIKRNSVTNKPVEDLIKVDKATGTIRLSKHFTSLSSVNLAKYKSPISYTKGNAYYWDIVDWGINEYTDYDDRATKIVSKKENGVTIISHTNDYDNGNNAWNGRAEFTIRVD